MSHLLEYLGVRVLEAGFSVLPGGAARALGAGLGRLAHGPVGIRREVARRQVRASFPDRPEAWVRKVVAACYRHFGRELAAMARMGGLEPGVLVERTSGVEQVRRVWREATADGRGAVIVTGHLGNWELAGALLAAIDVPVSAVVKRQSNERVDRRLSALRRRLGVEPVGMAEAPRQLPAAVAAGRGVALVADQDAGGRGVFVPFLGRPASTFRGPARLSLGLEVPLLFGVLVREGDGYRAILEPVGPADGPADDEEALTRAWVGRLERAIRKRPGQYFWFHRRWKTRPPEEEGGSGG